MKARGRGDKIPAWERRCMLHELQQAYNYVNTGMREQHNKDIVLSYISREIQELKAEESNDEQER